MKYWKYIVLTLLLAGCQVIPEDQQLLPLPQSEPQSNALLIEFTGFLCVNCPTAAEEAQRLHETYPDNLVVVAMHPSDNHFTQTTLEEYDYTCPEANEYYRYFGGTAVTPFPTGVVDMQQGWLDYPSWGAKVLTSIAQKKAGQLELEIREVNESERSFSVSAGVWASDEAQLLLWLVADDVLGAQMMPDGSTNLEYTHRHMLRASITEDPWGMTLSFDAGSDMVYTRAINYVVTDTIGGQVLPLDRYSVVAVLMDPSTKQLLDVKQIELKKLKI